MKYNLVFLLLFCTIFAFAQQEEKKYNFRTLASELDSIFTRYEVPGSQVIVVDADSIVWKLNYGYADVKEQIPVTDSTMFRIGSITKSFVAVAVMQMVEQGHLNLNDKISMIIPEVPFTNQWEETDPVLLVHLLEHTAGFDDIHLVEYASDAEGWSTLDGLTFHPHSRTSRFKPGMYPSYCNAGPPMAAYAVEKTSGKTIEEYIEENIFVPLGMEHSSFFNDPYVSQHLSKGYSDATTLEEAPYWHIVERSAGSINSTAREMAKYIQFFLNQGMADSNRILSATSIDRIGKPGSPLSAKAGCDAGYGLCIANSYYYGIRCFGHSGGMDGFLAYITYIPTLNIAYYFSINLGSGAAMNDIQDAMLEFLIAGYADTLHLQPATREIAPTGITGYYRSASSRNQIFRPTDWLTDIFIIREKDESLYRSKPFKDSKPLWYDGEYLIYRSDNGYHSPIVFSQKDGKTHLQIPGSFRNYYKVSGFAVWWQLLVTILCIVFIVSAILIGLFRFIVWLLSRKKRKNKLEKVIPVLAAVFALLWLIPLMLGMQMHPLERFGNPTIYSISITIITILFALLSVCAFLVSLRSFMLRMNKFYRIYLLLVSTACLLAAVFLFHWNWIGIRFWVY